MWIAWRFQENKCYHSDDTIIILLLSTTSIQLTGNVIIQPDKKTKFSKNVIFQPGDNIYVIIHLRNLKDNFLSQPEDNTDF